MRVCPQARLESHDSKERAVKKLCTVSFGLVMVCLMWRIAPCRAGAQEDWPVIAGQRIPPKTYEFLRERRILPTRPVMSDMELAARLDLDMPRFKDLKAAVDRRDDKAVEQGLVSYLNRKMPPEHVEVTGKPASNAAEAEACLRHEFNISDVGHGEAYNKARAYSAGQRINWYAFTAKNMDDEVLNRWWAWSKPLLSAYRETGDARYAKGLMTIVRLFYEDARPPAQAQMWYGCVGPWQTLTTACRPSSIKGIYRTIGGDAALSDADRVVFLKLLLEHAENLYLVSAEHHAQNWETAQAGVLLMLATSFPEFRNSRRWQERAVKRISENVRDVVLPDGGACSDRTGSYHFMVLHHYVGAYRQLRNHGLSIPANVRGGIERMYDLVMWVLTPQRQMPPLGYGSVARPDSQQAALREAAKLFPERADFAWFAKGAGHPPERTSKVLPHTGWAVMRSDWSRDALYLVMRYNDSAHAAGSFPTLLSLNIWAHGRAYMTDSGITGQYSAPEHRNWCRHTRSSNSVLVDGASQEHVANGGRLGSWESTPAFDYVAAVSDGYRKLGISHRRAILFLKPRYWLVYDCLQGDGTEHEYRWLGHFQPTTLTVDSTTKAAASSLEGGKRLYLVPTDPASLTLEQDEGPMSTPSGRQLGPYVALLRRTKEPMAFGVLIYPAKDEPVAPRVEDLKVTADGAIVPGREALGCRVVHHRGKDVIALARSSAPRAYGPLESDGEAAYVRCEGDRVVEAGLVRGRRLAYQGKMLVQVGPEIAAVCVLYTGEKVDVHVRGAGAVSIAGDSVTRVTVNGRPVEGKVVKARFVINQVVFLKLLIEPAPGQVALSAPTFSTDPAALCRALGLISGPPYSASPPEASVLVSWRTPAPTDAAIEYRQAGAKTWQRTVNPELSVEHQMVLSGLATVRQYQLRMMCRDADGRTGKLETVFTHPDFARARATEKQGLVAYYAFDQGKGTLVKDMSGNGNNGKIHGGARYVRSGKGYALRLDGVDDYVDCGERKVLDTGTHGTVELWCRVEALQGGLVSRSSGTRWEDQRLVIAVRADGRMEGALADGKTYQVTPFPKPRIGSWVHLAMTWDEKNVNLYRDGRLVREYKRSVLPETTGIRLKLGWSQGLGKQFYKGLIDEVRIYSRTLSAHEVRYHYHTTRKP